MFSGLFSKSVPKSNPVIKAPPILEADDHDVRKNTAFVIELQRGPKTSQIPTRLLKRQEMRMEKNSNEVSYTDEESRLIADIMREATLNDIKTKAGRVDHKIFDASRRRMCFDSLKEQAAKKKQTQSVTPDIRERQQKIKEMAASARQKASSDRRNRVFDQDVNNIRPTI